MSLPIYNKHSRFPVQPKKGLCRGCHGPVPKGRRTWCSLECDRKFNPQEVRHACWKRDKACQICLVPIPTFRLRYRTWQEEKLGIPKPIKWQMDHIVPFSEGGLTVLENVRCLCEACHKLRTKQWHKDRKATLTTENSVR